jgi:hypothetical protein
VTVTVTYPTGFAAPLQADAWDGQQQDQQDASKGDDDLHTSNAKGGGVQAKGSQRLLALGARVQGGVGVHRRQAEQADPPGWRTVRLDS